MTNHTPEPWHINNYGYIKANDAKSWLEGWARADQEIEILGMAIAKCEAKP